MSDSRRQIHEKWRLNWAVVDVVISGKSAIDMPRLSIRSYTDALSFINSYGYDYENSDDRRVLNGFFLEALEFIKEVLIPKEWEAGIQPPAEILACTDLTKLLMWASDKSEESCGLRLWSCAVLRVVHTSAHLDSVWGRIDARIAAEQIKQRFMPFLQTLESGKVRFGSGNNSIDLLKLEWKPLKTRKSVFLKLLHKSGNVAETIYDLFGVRLVTKNIVDAMLAVKYLRDNHITSFPNAYPSRSRNTLVNIELYKREMDRILQLDDMNAISKELLVLDRLLRDSPPVSSAKINPHTADAYRSIQITCRQLIKSDDLRSKDGVDNKSFFPFEIQIFDEESFEQSKFGEAAYAFYKGAQVEAARKRVLGEVLKDKLSC